MIRKAITILWMGALIWLVPFVVSFGFFDSAGKLTVTEELFKSVMIVVSSIIGCLMLYQYFRRTSNGFVRQGLVIGFGWLVINWLLDAFILIPMSGMSISHYFESIGLRYLQILVICTATGSILQLKSKPLTL
jgi:hypothetical protein